MRYFLLAYIFLSIRSYSTAQTASVSNDTTYKLVANTLFTNQNFKIVVGRHLIVGKASGENGWYQAITFKNPTAWPLLLYRDMELKQNSHYKLDESIRHRDKVRDFLFTGDTLTVTKIKRLDGKCNNKYWYVVTMRKKQGALSMNFRCLIMEAIRLGEVTVPEY